MKTIFHIGDSISIQYGTYLEKEIATWARIIRAKQAGDEHVNWDIPQGLNCGDSDAVRTIIETWTQGNMSPADVVLMNCGLHDIKTNPVTGVRQVPPERYRKNLEDIVKRLSYHKMPLIWVNTTHADEKVHNSRPNMSFYRYGRDVEDVNRIAAEIMNSTEVPILDLHGFTASLGEDLYCDHVHYHDWVRQRQASFIAEQLIEWFGG